MANGRVRRLVSRIAHGMRAQGGVSSLASKVKSTWHEEGLRGVVRKAGGLAKRAFAPANGGKVTAHFYAEWGRLYATLSETDAQQIRRHIAAEPLPTLTILVRLGSADDAQRDSALRSLQGQLYTNWRAIVALGSVRNLPDDILADSRFVVSSAASAQRGPEPPALLLMDGPVVLRSHALYLFALEAARGAKLVYADSDRLQADGNLVEPFFKPTYSPE